MSLSKGTRPKTQWTAPNTLAVAMNTRSRKRNQQLPDNACPEMNFREPNSNRDHPLTQPVFRDPFIKIANQLDPSSIAKFVRTCRAIYSICVNTADIKVVVNDFRLWDSGNGVKLRRVHSISKYCGLMVYRSTFDADVIRTKIFDIRLEDINFLPEITAEGLHCVRNFIERNNVKWIEQLSIGEDITVPLSDLMDFIKVVKPKSINAKASSVLPPEILMWMVTNLNGFTYFHSTSEELVLNSTASSLVLIKTRLSENAVRTIIQEWISGQRNFVKLVFGAFDKATLSAIFEDYDCYDMNYKGPILTVRPLVIKNDVYFYVLRDDDQILCVRLKSVLYRHLRFSVYDESSIPEAFKIPDAAKAHFGI